MQQRYRRVYAHIALRLRYAFFPLLALGALGWLAWDWQHERQLASAEDAIFDQIIGFRPWEPKPSRQVVVVEIDECSIQYMREQGAGGWPWSRQLHADLLDALDRAGVRAVGFDVQFTDASAQDPLGDVTLEAVAEGGSGPLRVRLDAGCIRTTTRARRCALRRRRRRIRWWQRRATIRRLHCCCPMARRWRATAHC